MEEDFDFVVYTNSDSGYVKPYSQYITLEVNKKQSAVNKTLKCDFGYINSVGEVPIEDRTAFGKLYSSATQYVDTVLPHDAGSKYTTVYVTCHDSSGFKRTKIYPVELDATTSDDVFELDETDPKMSDILIYSW